ncbi:ABC transporter permease [Pararobbsia silviterrae]|uniref:ABC transporter permease n=1 Tax=Pararobbsia silviterrae TaxID=1792498 RepID=UPI001314838E|nr:ABC transporter permease [Pararobbsia silviterrae]
MKVIQLAMLAATLVVAQVLASMSGISFFNLQNVRDLLLSSSVTLIVACGMSVVILIGSIDLSVGAIATTAGMVSAWLLPAIGWWALVLGVAIGLVCGLVNGALYVYLRIPSILVTLGMATALSGAVMFISGGESIAVMTPAVIRFVQASILPGVPLLALYALVVYVAVVGLQKKGVVGRHWLAIGGDENIARTLGAGVDRAKILAFALSGTLAGLGGVLLMARLGTATVSMGDFLTLATIAAVVLGGTAITGGHGGALGSIIGVLVVSTLADLMNLIAVFPYWQDIIKGLVLVVALLITSFRQREFEVK